LLDADLKTVLYSPTDKVWKLGDFGLSSNHSGFTAVADEYGMGTDGYRSPELLSEDPSFTNKSDIWALGCIVFEMVSGVRAFHGDWEILEYSAFTKIKASPNFVRFADAVDPYVSGFSLSSADHEWISKRLISALSIDPTARPTASELKGVFHTMLNAIPDGQRQGRV
jgi:serine/threonine protein kinase